jgi:stearoyl-CoA desaturase (delta-9 desaturase)
MTQFVLYLLGCLASQGPPLWWASKHRRHHKHCDTELDPHSPQAFSKLYAWLGWVWVPGCDGPHGSGIDEGYIQDHLKFPELAYGETFYPVPILVLHFLFYWSGGIGSLVYVSLLSSVACQVLTLWFNVMFHDNDQSEGTCKAMDLPMDPLANFFGEAHHAWHHTHPVAYHRPGLDVPYWTFIKPGLMLGFFWGENRLFATRKDN